MLEMRSRYPIPGAAMSEGVMNKRCSACKLVKLLKEFPPDCRYKDGCGTKCRSCARAVQEAYYAKYPEKEAARRLANARHGSAWYRRNRSAQVKRMKWYRILKMYGITEGQYDEMLKAQNFGCAICQSIGPGRNDGHFAIDHDHETGIVRGLLCQKCNCGIGFFDDDINRMERAIAYMLIRLAHTNTETC
jgi:hypothetical protein